jgi:ATP-dependent helicase HrpB
VRARSGPVEVDELGALLGAGFPDRIAQRRGDRRGRFRLRSGAGAFMAEDDVLAGEEFLVVADTDGDRRDARIRLAAGLGRAEVESAFGASIEEVRTMAWDHDRDDLVVSVEQRLGSLRLAVQRERPTAGPATVAALVDRVRATDLAVLPWTPASRSLQARAGFVRAHEGTDRWPDLADDALLADLDTWLAPMLVGARGRSDLDGLDLMTALRARLGWERVAALDRLAPERLDLPSGRRAPLAYGDGRPVVRARVQELYGASTTPAVLDGRVPVVFELTSPADRPIQVTDDLAGFWSGSWVEVRKDMAGRYPKHAWPLDPTTASPSGPGGRRR